MSEWREYKLEDVATVQTGPFGSQLHQKDYVDNGTPIITVEHLGDNRITYQNLPKVSNEDKERLKRYHLRTGDIVFSRVGSVDRRALVTIKEDGWLFSGRCLRVRADEKLANGVFLSYYFGQEFFKEYVRRIAVGATMPSINTKILSEVPVILPDLPTQTAIAEILSSLDDKIGLNNKINEELENLAQTLFKRWFIDFEFPDENGEPYKSSGGEMVDSELGEIPVGWEVGNLNDVSELIKISVKPFENPETIYHHYSLPEFDSGKMPSNDLGSKILSSKYKVLKHSVLVSKLNPRIPRIWTVMEPNKNSICSTEFQVLKPIDEIYLPFVSCLCSSDGYIASIQSKVTGTSSSHQRVNPRDIINYMMVVPQKSIIILFFKAIFDLLILIDENRKENSQIITLRDSLLPRLISGELEISETNT
jgi:type I restriction enzyme, S subunit